MLTPTKQVEIATRGMDAVFGYTQAAINATFEANARVLAVWSQLAQTVLPSSPLKEETWEWSGAPKRPHSTLLAAEQEKPKPALNAFAVWSDLMQTSQQTWFKGAPSPFAWWAWSPQSAVPATWPWAYGMIASGIPGSVAWPMAEANVALMDAAKKIEINHGSGSRNRLVLAVAGTRGLSNQSAMTSPGMLRGCRSTAGSSDAVLSPPLVTAGLASDCG